MLCNSTLRDIIQVKAAGCRIRQASSQGATGLPLPAPAATILRCGRKKPSTLGVRARFCQAPESRRTVAVEMPMKRPPHTSDTSCHLQGLVAPAPGPASGLASAAGHTASAAGKPAGAASGSCPDHLPGGLHDRETLVEPIAG